MEPTQSSPGAPKDHDAEVALVVGAWTAEGKVVSRGLIRQGYSVVATTQPIPNGASRTSLETESSALVRALVKSGGSAVGHDDEISDSIGAQRAVDRALETFGGLDLLVFCPHPGGERSLLRLDDGSWSEGLTAYLTSCFMCCQAAIRHMVGGQGPGRVVTLTGSAGLRTRQFGHVREATLSGAICGLVRSIALELRHKELTINAITLADRHPTTPNSKDGSLPQERSGVETLVPLIEFLCSPGGCEISGQVISVDGKRLSLLRTVETIGALAPEGGWTLESIGIRWHELTR